LKKHFKGVQGIQGICIMLTYYARIVPRICARSAGQSATIPLLMGLIFCNIEQNKSQLLDNGLKTILGFNLLV